MDAMSEVESTLGARLDLGVGAGVALLVHFALGLAIVLSPPGKRAAAAEHAAEPDGCASVVSPACVGAAPNRVALPAASDETASAIGERRCPEPVRRGQRREHEPPPAVAVDLLRAEVVANLGSETGKRLETGARPGAGGTHVARPEDKLAVAVESKTRLGEILAGGTGGVEQQRKLGEILGTASGKAGGEGTVNVTGSTYMRAVGMAVRSKLVLPPSIPLWERAGLQAKVRVRRMTASGGVLEWSWDKRSGNDDFDETVSGVMNRYKAGLLQLPAPPPHILDQINSQGAAIIVR
ncbi:MAG: hypothetical protein EXR79_08390 [Myxococcales bacterium]|nr:hypothetical protein [Myxococcales bacterium]